MRAGVATHRRCAVPQVVYVDTEASELDGGAHVHRLGPPLAIHLHIEAHPLTTDLHDHLAHAIP